MFSIGNDEMRGLPILCEVIDCPHCNGQHDVQYGEKVLPDGTKIPSKMLAFYFCPTVGQLYLCGINGIDITKRR